MATRKQDLAGAARRVARHRAKIAMTSGKRIEVTVPARDAPLVRELAAVLRAGGDDARRARKNLQSLTLARPAKTGSELVAFFRASPLVGENLVLERDRSSGRPVDI